MYLLLCLQALRAAHGAAGLLADGLPVLSSGDVRTVRRRGTGGGGSSCSCGCVCGVGVDRRTTTTVVLCAPNPNLRLTKLVPLFLGCAYNSAISDLPHLDCAFQYHHRLLGLGSSRCVPTNRAAVLPGVRFHFTEI
jgi:hypothetical protein